MKDFTARLKEARGSMTQAEIARILGIKQQNWARWEAGVVYPGAEKIHHICSTLGISADWLLGLKDGVASSSARKVEDLKTAIQAILKEY